VWTYRSANAHNIRSREPYWLVRDGTGPAGRPLDTRRECDVAIIGAGVTGALVADAVSGGNRRVLVLDQREVGHGSTSASTALLQYEIDCHLVTLEERLGRERAVRAYQAGLESLARLDARVRELGSNVGFERRASLYLASDARDVATLRTELAARRAVGIDAVWLEAADLRARFGLHAHGAIQSAAGALVDPLALTRALFEQCRARGVEIFTRTAVESLEPGADAVRLTLNTGGEVTAAQVFVCAGYESLRFLQRRVATLHNTYALVTEPCLTGEQATAMPLIWESARPYLYARPTRDGRLIVGGADVRADSAFARQLLSPLRVGKIARGFTRLFGKKLPPLAGVWAGTFAETEDGLPYIGTAPGMSPRIHFALCYGGNGITYSVQAAAILAAMLEGERHPLAELFGFARLDAGPSRPN
jgi:glycine/D-amino acid oxidase-like deaminating enzyme